MDRLKANIATSYKKAQHGSSDNAIMYDRYLERTLGKILPDAVCTVVQNRPVDPIESIAQALYQATDSQEYRRQRSRYLTGLIQAREDVAKASRKQKENLEYLKRVLKEKEEELIKEQNKEREALREILLDRQTEKAERARLEFLENVLPSSVMSDYELNDDEDEWTEEKIWKRIRDLNKRLRPKPRRSTLNIKKLRAAAERALKRGLQPVRVSLADRPPDNGIKTEKAASSVTTLDQPVLSPRELQRRDLERQLEEAMEKGNYELTETGAIVYASKSMDKIGLKPPKFRQEELKRKQKKPDRPDAWYGRRLHCQAMYEHELYTRCDYDNYKTVPTGLPRMTLNEFLAPRNTTPEPEDDLVQASERNSIRLPDVGGPLSNHQKSKIKGGPKPRSRKNSLIKKDDDLPDISDRTGSFGSAQKN